MNGQMFKFVLKNGLNFIRYRKKSRPLGRSWEPFAFDEQYNFDTSALLIICGYNYKASLGIKSELFIEN